MSYMNTKLRFEVGQGPLISAVCQGPCCLNPALRDTVPYNIFRRSKSNDTSVQLASFLSRSLKVRELTQIDRVPSISY